MFENTSLIYHMCAFRKCGDVSECGSQVSAVFRYTPRSFFGSDAHGQSVLYVPWYPAKRVLQSSQILYQQPKRHIGKIPYSIYANRCHFGTRSALIAYLCFCSNQLNLMYVCPQHNTYTCIYLICSFSNIKNNHFSMFYTPHRCLSLSLLLHLSSSSPKKRNFPVITNEDDIHPTMDPEATTLARANQLRIARHDEIIRYCAAVGFLLAAICVGLHMGGALRTREVIYAGALYNLVAAVGNRTSVDSVPFNYTRILDRAAMETLVLEVLPGVKQGWIVGLDDLFFFAADC